MSSTSFNHSATHLYLSPPLTEYLLDIATAHQEWYASVVAQLDETSLGVTSLEKSDSTKRIETWRRDVAARTPAAHLLPAAEDPACYCPDCSSDPACYYPDCSSSEDSSNYTSSEWSSSNSISSDSASSNPVSSAPSSTSSILRVWKRTVNTPGNGAPEEAHRAPQYQRLDRSSSRPTREPSEPSIQQTRREIVEKEGFQWTGLW